jgi:site-specific recombinase XerC
VNRPALQRLVETLRLKGYSPHTENTYRNEFAQLLLLLGELPVDSLTPDRLRSYMLYCTTEIKLSEATLHSRLNAIKFYFEQVLRREKFFAEIPRPKKHGTLPKHISQRDIKKLLDATPNLKHNTLLRLCYGMGLRVSEITGLKLQHIDSGNMQVLIARGKGKKDRYVSCNPKRRHNRQQTNSKTTDKMPTLRKIKRAAMPPTSRHKLQHILFCPTHPSPPTTRLSDTERQLHPIQKQSWTDH